MSIKPLPGDVVAQIKSSINIHNLNSVILGLLRNSLDAEATKINISLDYSRGNCSIEDDGLGILPSEFAEEGSLGQLYSTSKFPPRTDLYGQNGVFLASLAALSLLSITSHHHAHHSHNSLSFHNSRLFARHTPALPEQRLLTFPHGTRVTVRDLFGSMPVRVKHRAMQATKGISIREWDQLMLDVLALLLVSPRAVIVSIRETSSRQNLALKTKLSSNTLEPTKSVQKPDPLSRVPSLLQQASLCDISEKKLWVSLGASGSGISIDGCICLVPVATKRNQFISIGIEPLSNDGQNNVLYEEINRVFANSAFGCLEEENDSDGDLLDKTEGYTSRELKARKGVDRWPIFSLTISLDKFTTKGQTGITEIIDGRDTALSEILHLLRAMFYEFLKRHLFRPKSVILSADSLASSSKSKNLDGSGLRSNTPFSGAQSLRRQGSRMSDGGQAKSGSLSPAPSPLLHQVQLPERPFDTASSPFDSWSRVKAGRLLPTFKADAVESRIITSSTKNGSVEHSGIKTELCANNGKRTSPERPSLFDSAGRVTRKPFEDVDVANLIGGKNNRNPPTISCTRPAEEETITWCNPVTKKPSLVNTRTGFVIQAERVDPGSTPEPAPQDRLVFPGNVSKPPESTHFTKNDASWIDDILRKWKNPVFELTEAPIPRLPSALDTLGFGSERSRHDCHEHSHLSLHTSHEVSAMDTSGRLHKDDLRRAQLLAQVDKKFLLAKVQSQLMERKESVTHDGINARGTRPFLILIDQHAADERCRVETLMRDYFDFSDSKTRGSEWSSKTEVLEKPLRFELSSRERELLERYRSYFSHWGIVYELSANKFRTTEVSITRLPPSILERCRSEPRLVIELLRKEVWKMNDEPSTFRPDPTTKIAWHLKSDAEVQCDDRSWVSRFHGCPSGILDLINSRACRSAIMFNDVLSVEECTNLLRRLASTAFPFQCAHGRPSMIPLLDLGHDVDATDTPFDESFTGDSFASRFKEWESATK